MNKSCSVGKFFGNKCRLTDYYVTVVRFWGGFPKKKDREASCHLSLVSIIRNLTPQLGRHGHTFHNVFFLK